MKNTLFILAFAFLCLAQTATAQQRYRDGRDQTLASHSGRSGFFVSPIVEYSDLDVNWSTSVGGGLGFVAGDLFLGAYGLGMTDYDNLLDEDFERLDMGHGGFWVGYVFPQRFPVHLFTSVKAGWGAVNIDFDTEDYEDAFFAVTPEAGLEVNVFSWLRIDATVGHRFIKGLDESPNFSASDFEGMTGALTFRIGGFGRSRERWDD